MMHVRNNGTECMRARSSLSLCVCVCVCVCMCGVLVNKIYFQAS